MTKTYIQPETLVHQIKIESLLETISFSDDDVNKDENGDYNDEAKGFSFFFEEVEDNE